MWKKIKNIDLYLSFNSSNGFRLLLTNYVTLWHAHFTKSHFVQCLKDSNNKFSKILESVMLQHASFILLNPDDLTNAVVEKEGLSLILTLTKKFNYDFRIVLKFTEGSKELFFQKITLPLINTVRQLTNSQLELCTLIKEKDTEIDAYKSLDPSMTIPFHERTQKFNENEHLSKHKQHQEFFEYAEIPSILLNSTILVPEEKIDIQSENGIEINKVKQEIKVEPESQTEYESSSNFNELTDTKPELNIKMESALTVKPEYVKIEPQSGVPSLRKKKRILNL